MVLIYKDIENQLIINENIFIIIELKLKNMNI